MAQKFPDEKLGSYRLRIRQVANGTGFNGLVFDSKTKSDIMQADSPEALRADLLHWVGSSHSNYVGWDQTKASFLEIYPDGFSDANFIKKERKAKHEASEALRAACPKSLADGGDASIAAAKAAISATPLLSPAEKKRLHEVLEGEGAEMFLTGANHFADGDYENALREMDDIIRPIATTTWTAVTYLPFLWKPTDHIFLKPEASKAFSKRVGHPFHHQYAPALHPRVYEAMLNLVAETEEQLAELKPKDNIDIHGFISTIGKLKDMSVEDDEAIEDDIEEDDDEEEDEVPGIDE